MDCIRAYKFRIHPDAKRQREIDRMLILAQRLYNKVLRRAKEAYEKDKNSKINMSTLNRYVNEAVREDKEFLKLYSQTRQDVFVRLQRAFQNFFRRCKEKKEGKKAKAGFPRFKSIDRYKSIKYPQYNGSFSIEKERKAMMLRVSRIGRMQIEMHRNIEGKIKTLTIKKEAGNYCAIFTVVKETDPPIIKDTNPVGVDMGLNSFIAMSDGTKIKKPKFVRKNAKHIAKWQRIIARRHKGSKRRESAKAMLQRKWQYTTNQSNDFAHKLSDKLVNSGCTSFAVEKLNIQNMAKNYNLAQAIYNASWNRFIQMLSYKAESAGMGVMQVDPRDTTQECSSCHHIKTGGERLTLNDRIYHCNLCDLTMDRDLNASINIRNRALASKKSNSEDKALRGRAGLARTDGNVNAQGDICLYNANGIASSVEELRTYPAGAGEDPTFR